MSSRNYLVRVRDAAIAGLIATSAVTASAQINNPGVQQSGAVVAGHCVKWGPGVGQISDNGANCAASVTPSALTKTDDTNVTLTLTGTPATALLQAVGMQLGWTGTLAAGRLNSNVVQGVTNDTNVTGSIAGQVLTLGWQSTLSLARGGTGSGTQQGALNNIMCSPTGAGTLVYYNGTNWVCFAGNTTSAKILQEDAAGVPSWVVAGTGTVTSVATAGLATGGPITGTGTVTVTAAVKADQTTGSSNTVAVTPGVQQFHDSAVKVWVNFTGSTTNGAQTVNGSYNVSGVSRTSAGNYTVSFTTSFANANYTCSIAPHSAGSVNAFGQFSTFATGSVNANFVNISGPAAYDPTLGASVVCYGRQ